MLACRSVVLQTTARSSLPRLVVHAASRTTPPRLVPLVRGFASALDRVRAVQKEEAAAFDSAAKTRAATMPEELKVKLEEISRLRSSVDELVEVLSEHEFLGDGELLRLLQTDAAGSDGRALDIDDELARVAELNRRLTRRLEDVDATLGANPC